MLNDLFSSLVTGVFGLVGYVTNFLLTPINGLILTFLPTNVVDNFITNVNNAWSWLASVGTWAISWFGFSTLQLDVIKTLTIYMLTAPLAIKGVKLAISWYKSIKF